jgi:hypothetical protein
MNGLSAAPHTRERLTAVPYRATSPAPPSWSRNRSADVHIRRWLYGWWMWCRAIWITRRKKRGAGPQPWRYSLLTAAAIRFLIDGQHR